MTNKASILLTCATISVGQVFTSELAMSCSVPLPGAPCWRGCAVPWGLGAWEQLHPRDGVSRGVSRGHLSSTPEALSRVPCSEGVLFPFKTRPEGEARRLAALFLSLQPYKHGPVREEDSLDGPLSGGLRVLVHRAAGMKEAVQK